MNVSIRNAFIAMTVLVAGSAVALTGVVKTIRMEYDSKLVGRRVVLRIDVKDLHIQKQVQGDRYAGMTGARNIVMIKPATIVSEQGIEIYHETHGKEWLYATSGTHLTVLGVTFKRKTIELKVKADGRDDPTIITFGFKQKLDKEFSASATFDRLLRQVFTGI